MKSRAARNRHFTLKAFQCAVIGATVQLWSRTAHYADFIKSFKRIIFNRSRSLVGGITNQTSEAGKHFTLEFLLVMGSNLLHVTRQLGIKRSYQDCHNWILIFTPDFL
jgi:hypothetical protein